MSEKKSDMYYLPSALCVVGAFTLLILGIEEWWVFILLAFIL